jgi:hypothetical protein
VLTAMTSGCLPLGQEGLVGGPPPPEVGGGGLPSPEGGAGGGAIEAP